MPLTSVTFSIICFLNLTCFDKVECIGIPIDSVDFEKSVDRINELYSSNTIRAKEDFILSVRIYNTLIKNDLVDQKVNYKRLCDHFSKNLNETVSVLKASISKGMGYYSEKHKIFLGGQPDGNSLFCIR